MNQSVTKHIIRKIYAKHGIFELFSGDIHIAPCHKNGIIRYPHILDDICICDPIRIRNMFIHREEN